MSGTLARFFVRQDLRSVAMRTAEESIVGGKYENRIFGHSGFLDRRPDHADGRVHPVHHLVVDGHYLVVTIAIPPAHEALVLATLLALQREVLAVLASVVGGLGEFLPRVHLVENRIRMVGFMRSLETDRQTERFTRLGRLPHEVAPERPVGSRGMWILLGICLHARVSSGGVIRLARVHRPTCRSRPRADTSNPCRFLGATRTRTCPRNAVKYPDFRKRIG